MHASLARPTLAAFIALPALMLTTGPAQANATFSAFVDVAGASATDGYNSLISSRISANNLRDGILANVFGSGGAVLRRTSGTAYPASFGIYEWGGPRSTFELSVANAVQNLSSVTFQSFINIDTSQGVNGMFAAGNMPVLSFNGGSQLLSATSYTATPVAAGNNMDGTPVTTTSPSNPSYAIFNWDLSAITTPITSFTVQWATDAHSSSIAFQLDQVAAVPEPQTYAFAAVGLGVCAWAGLRRRNVGARAA